MTRKKKRVPAKSQGGLTSIKISDIRYQFEKKQGTMHAPTNGEHNVFLPDEVLPEVVVLFTAIDPDVRHIYWFGKGIAKLGTYVRDENGEWRFGPWKYCGCGSSFGCEDCHPRG